MTNVLALCSLLLLESLSFAPAGQVAPAAVSKITLDSSSKLELTNTQAQWEDYRGRHALHLYALPGHEHAVNEQMYAVFPDSDFQDGTIEVSVAGARRAGYPSGEGVIGFKGMIGITFRIQGEKRETIYIRPENARLDDQLFRNRSTQYESIPDFPWDKLREENPGKYESYVDLEPGAWTKLKIEISGTKARLFVNDAPQPCLIVNDLKLGASHGKIGLWTRVSTDAYFSDLRVAPAEH